MEIVLQISELLIREAVGCLESETTRRLSGLGKMLFNLNLSGKINRLLEKKNKSLVGTSYDDILDK